MIYRLAPSYALDVRGLARSLVRGRFPRSLINSAGLDGRLAEVVWVCCELFDFGIIGTKHVLGCVRRSGVPAMKSLLCLPMVLFLSFCLESYPQVRAQDAAPPGPPPSQGGVAQSSPASSTTIAIPGPIRSFLRMAAISQKVSPEEIAPLL